MRRSRLRLFRIVGLVSEYTLKPTGALSHTEALLGVSREIMAANGVAVEILRPVDYDIPPGVYPDMRDHGFARDGSPELCREVMAADILVVGTPIWTAANTSTCAYQ